MKIYEIIKRYVVNKLGRSSLYSVSRSFLRCLNIIEKVSLSNNLLPYNGSMLERTQFNIAFNSFHQRCTVNSWWFMTNRTQ